MNNNLEPGDDKPSFYKNFFNEGLYVVNEPELAVNEPVIKQAEDVAGQKHAELMLNGSKMAETLLLFNYPQAKTIPEGDKVFVNQVLNAVQLNLENVAWLNVGLENDFQWEALKNHPQIKKIVAFGLDEAALPATMAEGEIHIYNEQKILRAGKLADISMNKSQKKLLWDGLKQLYGI